MLDRPDDEFVELRVVVLMCGETTTLSVLMDVCVGDGFVGLRVLDDDGLGCEVGEGSGSIPSSLCNIVHIHFRARLRSIA